MTPYAASACRRSAVAMVLPVLIGTALATGATPARAAAAAADRPTTLLSWNDGPSKQALVDFVEKVTTIVSPDFVPPAERIAVFDNDGTLWCETPIYFQVAFALDRVKALAPQHPEWKEKEPFKS